MASHIKYWTQGFNLELLDAKCTKRSLQGEIEVRKVDLNSTDQLLEEAKELYKKWSNLLFYQKRSIIEVITEGIRVVDFRETVHPFSVQAIQPECPLKEILNSLQNLH